METLQIKKEDAIKAHQNAKKSGKKLLENLFGKALQRDVTERIKTFDDVLQELEIGPIEFKKSLEGLSNDEIAYRQIKLIAQAFNEGWEPNWKDSSEYKYYPWFDMDSSSGSGFSYDDYGDGNSDSPVGSRLCFKTRELAEYVGEQFEDLYRDYFVI